MRNVPLFTTLTVVVSATSLASLAAPLVSTSDQTLPEIVVTATRTAQTVNDSQASVTVINHEQIERSQALTLPDVLRSVVGLDLVSNGGLGQASSFFLRGTKADHVLVLIDGIKVGSATLGTVPFQDFPVAQIDHIEVVRGPRSSLYGSEAIGGVIQIFTRKGDDKSHYNASVGGGSNKTYQAAAGMSNASTESYSYNLQANYLQSGGFNTCQGDLSNGCFTIEPDKDGYDNTSVSLRVGHRVNEKLKVEGQALRIEGNTQYDSPGHNELDFLQQVLSLQSAYVVNDAWDMKLNVGESRDEEDNFGKTNLPRETYNTKRSTLSWQNNWVLADEQEVTLGYDYQKDEVSSSVEYTGKARTNQGYFAQYQHRSITLGLRQDDNEQFGSHTTYNAAVGYPMAATTQLYFSYGTAFKAPTFNELYYPSVGGFPAFGNPHLRPEKSQSFELGIKGTQPDYTWSLSAFQTKIDDLIASYPAANIVQAKILGGEGAIRWHKEGWEFYSNLSWLTPEDELTGNLLPRRAKTTFNVGLAETRGPARLGMDFLYQSYRYDDVANTQRLDGYRLFKLNGEYRFTKNWIARAQLDNVFDEEYETVRFYNMPGRTFFLSLHYQQ